MKKKNQKNFLKNIPNVYSIIPKMTFLFQSTSEERRSFLDQMIFVVEDNHKKNILNYEKHKSERMRIFKKMES